MWSSSSVLLGLGPAGYGRVVLALLSFFLMPCCPWPAVFCYLLSGLLDAFDGHAARALNQCEFPLGVSVWEAVTFDPSLTYVLLPSATKFGAMLDMLTDRCATMCLLVNLSLLYPSYTFLFQLSMSLDVASHWLHLHRWTTTPNQMLPFRHYSWFIYTFIQHTFKIYHWQYNFVYRFRKGYD